MPFADEQFDQAYDYDFSPDDTPVDTPVDDWDALDEPYLLQQIELRDNPLIITEHRFARYRNLVTGQIITAPVPDHLRRQGLFGPRLRATTTPGSKPHEEPSCRGCPGKGASSTSARTPSTTAPHTPSASRSTTTGAPKPNATSYGRTT